MQTINRESLFEWEDGNTIEDEMDEINDELNIKDFEYDGGDDDSDYIPSDDEDEVEDQIVNKIIQENVQHNDNDSQPMVTDKSETESLNQREEDSSVLSESDNDHSPDGDNGVSEDDSELSEDEEEKENEYSRNEDVSEVNLC